MHFQLLTLLAAALLAQAQLPPVGPDAWTEALSKATAALSKLSQNDKVSIVTGVGWDKGPCVGNTAPISSIRYPQLCLQDGPLGIRFATNANSFTPGIQAGSTWDLPLIRKRGAQIGAEARGCGVHVLLGPAPGALGKIPHAGRNWEGFGADPYLQGAMSSETIQGIQSQGVQATVKHFLANEQERNRETMSSNVPDRPLHELYLWPFADAVRANVASVMCSYNKLNGTWACENDRLMNQILKKELAFPGFVVSDWNAQHSTALSATAGLDLTMPGSDFNGRNVLWGPALNQAVSANQVPLARLNDMVKRVLAGWYLVGQDAGNYPQINIKASVSQQAHRDGIREVARDGIVLLKNAGGILPLKKSAKLALVGSASVVNPRGRNACVDRGCNEGALGMGWGSGTTEYPYFVAPHDALKRDGNVVALHSSDSTSGVANAVKGADVVLVFITADSGEGYITTQGVAGDRPNLDPWHNGNALVRAAAEAHDNVVVVVQSVGPIVLESVLALPGVKAVVWAGLGSQETGNALADVIYEGGVNPSGKLVYTIAKREADYGSKVVSGDDDFKEGLFVDYRHFDKAGVEPRYEFGFGLSYTNFTYAGLTVASTATAGPATGKVVPGGRADLWDEVAAVSAMVENTGGVDGAEVAQLYLTLPSSAPETPVRQLRGFEKLKLKAGEKKAALFNLKKRDLSYWDVARQEWVVPAGKFVVSVGASSRDLRLVGEFTV
ncbi:glycoside hydrolase superfamily [Podospora conica]|nr:glycoside hydrolase superfamily [Schizothecium conicum]